MQVEITKKTTDRVNVTEQKQKEDKKHYELRFRQHLMIITAGTIYCATTLYQVLLFVNFFNHLGLLDGSVGKKNLPAMRETQERRVRSLGLEDPRRGKWQRTPISLPKKSHGQRNLVGYSSKARKELDTTEQLSTVFSHYKITEIFQLVKTKESRVIVSIKECRFVI